MAKRYRRGYITIDVDEVLEEATDEDILEEVKLRNLSLSVEREATDRDLVEEAYVALQRGNILEARSILDRILFPKWGTKKECEEQYVAFKS